MEKNEEEEMLIFKHSRFLSYGFSFLCRLRLGGEGGGKDSSLFLSFSAPGTKNMFNFLAETKQECKGSATHHFANLI